MGVVAILTFLLADFTFETKLNKIKIYNQQDKIQARLNAEAGLNMALAKLRLYQEGRNRIEKDDAIKNFFPSSDLESIIIQPFIYPPPLSSKASIIQRSALDEFLKKTNMRGELSLTISKISGFLNPNALRLQPQKNMENGMGLGALTNSNSEKNGEAEKKNSTPPSVIIEQKITETLQRLLKDKSDTDEEFHQKYGNLDANYLVKELKYYVNDREQFQDIEKPEIEAKFSQKNITPKYAPMTSIDELYFLPSWDDAIVDLIKDRMSVHEVSAIAVNEITLEDLKILFPAINSIQTEEFFKYRDGDVDKKIKPRKFKNAEDFKRVITSELNILSESDYNERISSLKSAGLVIDTAGKLYKVISRGTYNNAIFNLIAYVDLPIKPQPKAAPRPSTQTEPSSSEGDDGNLPASSEQNQKEKEKEKDPPIELLSPRVVEIRLE